MKWKAFAAIVAAIVMCTGIPAYASSLLDNTFGQSEEDEQSEGYEVPQVSLHLTEQKILSPAFNNAAVGKTVIPEGWSITVMDLMIGSESITCPNAVMVNVKDPEGKCELTFLSRREYEQQISSVMGYQVESTDDAFDFSIMMHTLRYREAAEACDLMASVLYPDALYLMHEKTLSDEEQAVIQTAGDAYYQELVNAFVQYGMEQQGSTLAWSDVSAARRTYAAGNDAVTVDLAVAGYEIDTVLYSAQTQYIFWTMPCVFAMRTSAEDHAVYEEVFDAFCLSTSVSAEFEELRNLNSQRLMAEWLKARNSGGTYTPSTGSWDDNESSTVDSGDTYSAFDAWDDYIKDETDYTTGDGSHVKVPSYYDHVFEGEDGNIYAGNSVDGPPGSTELDPTDIGSY